MLLRFLIHGTKDNQGHHVLKNLKAWYHVCMYTVCVRSCAGTNSVPLGPLGHSVAPGMVPWEGGIFSTLCTTNKSRSKDVDDTVSSLGESAHTETASTSDLDSLDTQERENHRGPGRKNSPKFLSQNRHGPFWMVRGAYLSYFGPFSFLGLSGPPSTQKIRTKRSGRH